LETGRPRTEAYIIYLFLMLRGLIGGCKDQHARSYQWLDFETAAEARALVEHAGQAGQLPLVLFPDGSHLFDPTLRQLGEKLGLKTRPQMPAHGGRLLAARNAAPGATFFFALPANESIEFTPAG
jgi:hypothetical protein